MAASLSAFFNVTDIERSLAFYRKLGFKVDREHKDRETGETTYADLSLNGAELGLGNIASNDDPDFRAWVATPLGAGVVVYVTVPNVDRIHQKAVAAGAVIEFAPIDRPYGRLFMLNDPDGYSISFIREPRRESPRKGARKGARKSAKKASKKPAKKAAKTTTKKTAKQAAKRPPARRARR